jgi:molybdopterin molybdotransferase
MPEFLRLSPPTDALQTFLEAMKENEVKSEEIGTIESLDRVIAIDIKAPHALPEFTRSTMDGYALHARDTFGVSDSQPGYLKLIGEVPMGEFPKIVLKTGSCASIHTGGLLPEGADAVIMLEYTQFITHRKTHDLKVKTDIFGKKSERDNNNSVLIDSSAEDTEIEISRAVAEGENIIQTGEDVEAGQLILAAGTRIRPAHIGGCMALGLTKLRVAKCPIIGILSSGDELVTPEKKPKPGQVRDINSYSLAAIVRQAGGEPKLYGIMPDDLGAMKTIAARALDQCAAVVVTAGSSASARDMTAEAISSLGKPGVLIHGVNVRPGKPTILAVCDGKAVIGLPGNPVSALVIANLFVVPMVEKLLGMRGLRPRPSVLARLNVNVPSIAGREDWIAVKLFKNRNYESGNDEMQYQAEPVFGKSSLIFSLATADGLICIPSDLTGMSAGEKIDVVLI